MKITCIVPVGPGHQESAHEALDSFFACSHHPDWELAGIMVPDELGELGRSHARNLGIQAALEEGTDWIFFLDADDVCFPGAIRAFEVAIHVRPDLEAVWGELWNEYGLYRNDGSLITLRCEISPGDAGELTTFGQLVDHGPFAAIHVGNFVKAELVERVGGWMECWDIGEDVEFNWACAAHARRFIKMQRQITKVRIHKASARGPRGYGKLQPGHITKEIWNSRVRQIHEFWKARGPVPFSRKDKVKREHGLLYGKWAAWKKERSPWEIASSCQGSRGTTGSTPSSSETSFES